MTGARSTIRLVTASPSGEKANRIRATYIEALWALSGASVPCRAGRSGERLGWTHDLRE
jgi:hypothetical protein